jgi:hypothetical protein
MNSSERDRDLKFFFTKSGPLGYSLTNKTVLIPISLFVPISLLQAFDTPI